MDVPSLGQALGIHAATSRQAATGRHALSAADGTDRRPRADHVGRDRRARQHAPMSGSRLRPPDRRRRAGSRWPRVRTAPEASRHEHHRAGAGLRTTELIPVPHSRRQRCRRVVRRRSAGRACVRRRASRRLRFVAVCALHPGRARGRYLTATMSIGLMSGAVASSSGATDASAFGISPEKCAWRASSVSNVSNIP